MSTTHMKTLVRGHVKVTDEQLLSVLAKKKTTLQIKGRAYSSGHTWRKPQDNSITIEALDWNSQ